MLSKPLLAVRYVQKLVSFGCCNFKVWAANAESTSLLQWLGKLSQITNLVVYSFVHHSLHSTLDIKKLFPRVRKLNLKISVYVCEWQKQLQTLCELEALEDLRIIFTANAENLEEEQPHNPVFFTPPQTGYATFFSQPCAVSTLIWCQVFWYYRKLSESHTCYGQRMNG